MSRSGALLHFPRERTVVRRPYLLDFVAWQLRRTPRAVPKLRRLAALSLFGRLGSKGIDPRRLDRFREAHEASWMQYESDGSRFLMVDVRGRTVMKVQAKVDARRVNLEVEIRRRVGRLAPLVVSHDAATGVIVEDWLTLSAASEGAETMRAAIQALAKSLYAPKVVNAGKYVLGLGCSIDAPGVQRFLESRSVDQVSVTDVHGDLWLGNLGVDPEGMLVVLDWEYARACADSHDAWTYLMQPRMARGLSLDRSFVAKFAEARRTLFDAACSDATAEAYHLLHLAERYSFFASLDLRHKAHEMAFFQREMTALLES